MSYILIVLYIFFSLISHEYCIIENGGSEEYQEQKWSFAVRISKDSREWWWVFCYPFYEIRFLVIHSLHILGLFHWYCSSLWMIGENWVVNYSKLHANVYVDTLLYIMWFYVNVYVHLCLGEEIPWWRSMNYLMMKGEIDKSTFLLFTTKKLPIC